MSIKEKAKRLSPWDASSHQNCSEGSIPKPGSSDRGTVRPSVPLLYLIWRCSLHSISLCTTGSKTSWSQEHGHSSERPWQDNVSWGKAEKAQRHRHVVSEIWVCRGFRISRCPGKVIVYPGCFFLSWRELSILSRTWNGRHGLWEKKILSLFVSWGQDSKNPKGHETQWHNRGYRCDSGLSIKKEKGLAPRWDLRPPLRLEVKDWNRA